MKRSMSSWNPLQRMGRARRYAGHAVAVAQEANFTPLQADHAVRIGLEALHLLRMHEGPGLVVGVDDRQFVAARISCAAS